MTDLSQKKLGRIPAPPVRAVRSFSKALYKTTLIPPLSLNLYSGILFAMTYDEFSRHVRKAGLTIKEFAEIVRMNRGSFSNLAKKGEVPSHWAVVAVLLGLLGDKHIEFRDAISEIDITPKRPRGAGKDGEFGGSKQGRLFSSPKTAAHAATEMGKK